MEGGGYLLDVGTSAYVEEVGGVSPVLLDHVHSGHGEPGSVDHAADVAIQSHIVESCRDGLLLVDVGLFRTHRVFPHLYEFVLSELGVVVDADFGVETVESVGGVERPRVDLDLAGVDGQEHLVESLHLLDRVFLDVSQAERLDDLFGDVVSQAHFDVDGLNVDVFGVDVLDLHASELAGDDARALTVPVLDEGQIYLLFDVDALVHQDRVDLQALLEGLVSHEVVPDHLFRVVMHLLGTLAHLHSALQSAAQRALPPAPRMHLTLQNQSAPSMQLLGSLLSTFRCQTYLPVLNTDLIRSHQVFALIFVQVEVLLTFVTKIKYPT